MFSVTRGGLLEYDPSLYSYWTAHVHELDTSVRQRFSAQCSVRMSKENRTKEEPASESNPCKGQL